MQFESSNSVEKVVSGYDDMDLQVRDETKSELLDVEYQHDPRIIEGVTTI
jgi:hypothetical protein